MKLKHTYTLIMVLALLFTITPTALAASKYATEPVYMREGPGTRYKIILELQTGDEVEVIGQSGNWSKVVFSGKTGYVFTKYLKEGAFASDKTEGTAVSTANVNIRSGPGTKYKKLGILKKGTIISYNAVSGDWISFEYNGKKAYANLSYFTLSEQSNTVSTDISAILIRADEYFANNPEHYLGLFVNDNGYCFRLSKGADIAKTKRELDKIFMGKLDYSIVTSSMPSYVNQKHLNDLGVSILNKYSSLPAKQKAQFIVAEAYYSANDDKYYVGILNLDKTKEKLFKQHISDWEYITLESVSSLTLPKV